MKKILSALLLISAGHCAFPQNLDKSAASGNPEVAISSTEPAKPASAIHLNDISTKAVRDFKKAFKTAADEKWYEMPDGYRVTFTSAGTRCRLDYDKKGNWQHTIRYYDEKKLPTEVRRLVVSTYLDYSIRNVEEIEVPRQGLSYIIHLEGQTNWINVKVLDGEIFELEKITKS